MDKIPLKTYHFGELQYPSMKQATRILLSSLVLLSFSACAAEAKGHHAVRHVAPAGGGVMLSTPNPQTPVEHNNRGVELGSKGLWPDAIKEHEMALAGEPWNKEFRTNLSGAQLRYGNQLYHQGKIYEAIKQYRGALFVDPDNAPADEGLDKCYERTYGADKALNVQFRRSMAEDFETKGQYEDAIVEYRKVLKMNDSGKSHADLGYVLIKAGKPVDGYQELRIAVQKTETWSNNEVTELAAVHRKLAEILTDYAYKARDRGQGTKGMQRLANAAVEYKRAVTLNPADAQAIAGFIEVVRECCTIQRSFDNYLMLGGAYLLGHDFAHAKMCYEQAYKIDPRRPELAQARVAYHQAVARWPNASEELVAESVGKVQQFLANDPDNPRWWYILGRLQQHQGNVPGALESYRKAEKINHLVDPDLEVQIKILGGQPQLPEYAQAQPATGAAPGTAIATTAGAGGAPPVAGAAGKPPAQAAPAVDPRALATYAKVEQLMSSNPDEALHILDGVLDKNPADGHAWFLKGNVLRKQGNLDEAASAFRMAAGMKEPDADDELMQINTIRVQDNIQRAEQFVQQNNLVRAADELNDAAVKAPNLAVVHRKLSDVLRKMNDSAGADREMQKANDLENKKK
jgi:tetratricopeptide (TPR) repeat protein